jgi:hypothetical protein
MDFAVIGFSRAQQNTKIGYAINRTGPYTLPTTNSIN